MFLLSLIVALSHPTCDAARRDVYLQTVASLREAPSRADPEVNRHHFVAAAELGCASVLTSSDGRVRVWRFALEKLASEGDDDTTTPQRGVARLQWLDAAGRIHVHEDVAGRDFHLDAIIDQIVPIDLKAHTYLLLGLRAYATTYAGSLPRRFAEVVRLTDQAQLVPGAFRSKDGRAVDVLWLRAPEPETGKFRHHVFSSLWLRYDARTRAIAWAPVDPSGPHREKPPPLPASPRVATLRQGAFDIATDAWGDMTWER